MMPSKPFFAYRSFRRELQTVRRFYEAGIRQFCVFPANTTNSLGQPYVEYPPNWVFFDAYEFEHADRQIADLLSVAPEAELLCMIDLNSPNWLVRQLMWTSADSTLGLTNALTTARWREETEKYLRALLSHLESAWPNRIRAYILACGMTDEWMDYSKGCELAGKRSAYRQWSVEHGWDDPVSIPDLARRFRSDPPLFLRDPEKDAAALRYWKFISECVAEGIASFTEAAREMIPEQTALGVFYGYILQLGRERLVQCGHLAYEKVCALSGVDFLISPGCYYDREMGGGAGFMAPNGTLHLHGKNAFHEIDHGTSTANYQLSSHVRLKWMKQWPDETADVAGLRREFCRSLFHGASLWWFDMWGGYYDSETLTEEIGRFQRISDRFADTRREPDAEIAVIVDPDSALLIDDEAPDSIADGMIPSLLRSCNRCGAPYRVYSFRDLPRIPDLSPFRLILFPGLFEVTEEKERILRERILTAGRTVVWLYGAAVSDGRRRTPSRMRTLTGFPETCASFTERKMEGWNSVFVPDSRSLPESLLRTLAEKAGVHFYTDLLCPVWASRDLLMIHTAESGRHTIRLRRPADVRMLLGSAVPERTAPDRLEYVFSGPETILLHLTETGPEKNT